MLTVETAEQLILSSRPRGGLFRGPVFILLGLSLLLGALSADTSMLPNQGLLSWLLPELVLIAVGTLLAYSIRKQREISRCMRESIEAVQLREWPRAFGLLSRILRRPVPHPAARAESLLALAVVAESADAFEASQRIYERLLQERTADPVQLHTARVGLGTALLRTGQTTDAVGLIDRLEREELPGSLRAHSELLALFREITMGHAADRLDRADERRALFRRHLGTRAGQGYALLAAAYHVVGNHERAAALWHDATMLVSESELLRRFGELKPLIGVYPPASVPADLTASAPPTTGQVRVSGVSQ